MRVRRVVGAALLLGFATWADVACQNFISFGARSKAAECRQRLPLLMAQVGALDAGVALTFDALSVERGSNRYAYVIGALGQRTPAPDGGPSAGAVYLRPDSWKFPGQRVWAPSFPLPSGATAGRGDAGVVLVCAGDLDIDDGFDVWSIADFVRVICGEPVPAGALLHEQRDVLAYRNPLRRWFAEVPTDEVAQCDWRH